MHQIPIPGCVRLAALLLLGVLLGTGQGMAQEFGKNKVQYRTFDWKFIQSAHFDIYFYDDAGENLANFTADVAEEALVDVQQHLRYRITDRIALVVYNSKNEFQQTNVVDAYMPEGVGGVTELFKNRVVIPYEGDWEKFRHVIHHELVHAIINDKFYGGSIQSVISNNVQVFLPIWMNEGLAEFESQGGYDVETDMFIRDAVIGQYMPPLQNLGGYFAYRGGQAFYWYVAENYGRDKIGELLDRILISSSIDAAFQGAFGKTVEEFNEQFQYDLKKFYWPDIADRKRPRDFARPLTDHEEDEAFLNSSPSISPNGELFAFISDRDGPRSVFIGEVDQPNNVERLVEGENNVSFEELHLLAPAIAWSPDSRRIAIAVKSGGHDVIYLIDVESGDREKLEFDLDAIYSVNWSPDGIKLAFQGIKGDRSDIYTYDLRGKELRNITDDIFSDFDPEWAQDNTTIYFLSDRRDNPIRTAKSPDFKVWNYDYDWRDIYAVDVNSLTLSRITNDAHNEMSPTPGPDGSLVFVSDKNGIGNIYVMESPGAEPKPITNSISGIEQMSITPDGGRLVFSSWNESGYDVFMMQAPLERTVAEGALDKTNYLEKVEETSEVAFETDSTDEAVTAVTEVEGYGDVEIDLDDAVTAEPAEEYAEPETYTSSAAPPPGAMTDTGTYRVQDYKVKFSSDVVQAGGGYSAYGAQTSVQALFSDLLGDHRIFVAASLQYDLVNSDFLAVYEYLPKRIDYSFSAFQDAVFLRLSNTNDIARFRQLGLAAMASNPFDRFSRLEGGVTLMNVSREGLQILGQEELENQSKFMAIPSLSYVFDNTEFLLFSPVTGTRYNLTLQGSPKIGTGGVGFYSLLGDARHYIPLDKWGFYSIAARFSGGASFGPNPQQFFIGGMDGWWINYEFGDRGLPLENAEDYSLMTPGYPLRGYAYAEQIGSKYGLANLEFRFPLAQAFGTGLLPMLFQYLSGAIFVDAGTAWNDDLNLTKTSFEGTTITDDLLLATGIGARTYLFGFPLRMDVAWRYDLDSWSKPMYYFSVGQDF